MIVQVPGRSHKTYTDASVLETLPKLQGVHNKNSKEEFQLHGRQGGTDQDIRPRGDCRDPSHGETEKGRDPGGSSTGVRGGAQSGSAISIATQTDRNSPEFIPKHNEFRTTDRASPWCLLVCWVFFFPLCTNAINLRDSSAHS